MQAPEAAPRVPELARPREVDGPGSSPDVAPASILAHSALAAGYLVPSASTGPRGEPGYVYVVGARTVASLTASGAYYLLPEGAVYAEYVGPSGARPQSSSLTATRHTDIGPEGTESVLASSSVLIEDAWPGISVEYQATPQGLKYSYTVVPGADAGLIAIQFPGAGSLEVADGGTSLVAAVGPAVLEDVGLRAWVEETGEPVPCTWRVEDTTARLEAGSYSGTLVVDPLVYSTLIGSFGQEEPADVSVSPDGSVYVAGWTDSVGFPTTAGSYNETHGLGDDAFVLKLFPNGSMLEYATFVGGWGDDRAEGLAVDNLSRAWIVGSTSSEDFPATTGAYSTSLSSPPDTDAFAAVLSDDGSSLEYATYIGGMNTERAYDVVVDQFDYDAYVCGYTNSPDFPGKDSWDTSFNGQSDGFVLRLSPTGSGASDLIWSGFLGTASYSSAALALSNVALGSIHVTGWTTSPTFWVAGGFDPVASAAGNREAFCTRLGTSGTRLRATYIGDWGKDVGTAVYFDADDDQVYVAGYSEHYWWSGNEPEWYSASGYDETVNSTDGWLVSIYALQSLTASTRVGGSDWDYVYDVGVDGEGRLWVVGKTNSTDLPTSTNAYNSTAGGGFDSFVSRYSADLSLLSYSTYIGAAGNDSAISVAVINTTTVSLVGTTDSDWFPTTTGAYNQTYGGSGDVFSLLLSAGVSPSISTLNVTTSIAASSNFTIYVNCTSDSLVVAANITFGGVEYVMWNSSLTVYHWTQQQDVVGAYTYTVEAWDADTDSTTTDLAWCEVGGDVPYVRTQGASSSCDLHEYFVVNVNATDSFTAPSGLSTVYVSYRGSNYTGTNNTAWNWTVSVEATLSGANTYTVYAQDAAGRVNSTSGTLTVGYVPYVVVTDVPTSVVEGQPVVVQAKVTDSRTGDSGVASVDAVFSGLHYEMANSSDSPSSFSVAVSSVSTSSVRTSGVAHVREITVSVAAWDAAGNANETRDYSVFVRPYSGAVAAAGGNATTGGEEEVPQEAETDLTMRVLFAVVLAASVVLALAAGGVSYGTALAPALAVGVGIGLALSAGAVQWSLIPILAAYGFAAAWAYLLARSRPKRDELSVQDLEEPRTADALAFGGVGAGALAGYLFVVAGLNSLLAWGSALLAAAALVHVLIVHAVPKLGVPTHDGTPRLVRYALVTVFSLAGIVLAVYGGLLL